MNNVLNFNRFLFTLFLAFVSFLDISLAKSPTSGQEVKEAAPAHVQDSPSPAPAASPESKASEEVNPLDAKIESLKTQIRKNPRNIKKIVELADTFYQKADYEKTTLLLWKQIDKIDSKGILLLARAHEARKEPTEMIRALNVLLGKDDKNVEAFTLMGNAYSLLKKNKEALENYKKAIELNSKYEPAYLGVQKLYEQRNPPNLYELRILFQDMIENMGPKPEYLQKLCEVNAKDDNTFETAIETCRQATLKDPKTANAYVNLANSLKIAGKNDEAVSILKKAARDFPKSEFAQYTYGKFLDESKNTVEAMKFYKAGTEADPTSGRSWMGLASTAFEVKKYELALIAYKNACKYDKNNAVAFRRATTVLRNNKVSDWIGKYEAGSESCP